MESFGNLKQEKKVCPALLYSWQLRESCSAKSKTLKLDVTDFPSDSSFLFENVIYILIFSMGSVFVNL